MRGVASSLTHCGRKPARQMPWEKTTSIVLYVVLLLPRNIFIGQLQLQLSYYSLVALQAFLLSEMWLLRGLEGPQEKNFLGSLSLAILSGPLINYAIIRPLLLRSLCAYQVLHNATTCKQFRQHSFYLLVITEYKLRLDGRLDSKMKFQCSPH